MARTQNSIRGYLSFSSGRLVRVGSYLGASWWLTRAPGCMFLPGLGAGFGGGGAEWAPLRPGDAFDMMTLSSQVDVIETNRGNASRSSP
jgi:hypothetical protein